MKNFIAMFKEMEIVVKVALIDILALLVAITIQMVIAPGYGIIVVMFGFLIMITTIIIADVIQSVIDEKNKRESKRAARRERYYKL